MPVRKEQAGLRQGGRKRYTHFPYELHAFILRIIWICLGKITLIPLHAFPLHAFPFYAFPLQKLFL